MLEMLKGRNLINFIGIPMWLLLIYKGGLYYCIFILACSAFALGEFYSIMEKKGAKPLQIHLEAGLKDGKVDHLKGKFGSEEIYGQGWSVKNIESKISQKKQEEFQFDLKASAFEWGEGFRYQDLIANQRKQLELKDEVQSLKDLSARVVLDTEGGRIERFRGKWLKVPLQFEGGWVRGEHLEGQFRRTKPSKTSELILQ